MEESLGLLPSKENQMCYFDLRVQINFEKLSLRYVVDMYIERETIFVYTN